MQGVRLLDVCHFKLFVGACPAEDSVFVYQKRRLQELVGENPLVNNEAQTVENGMHVPPKICILLHLVRLFDPHRVGTHCG